ncbi:MAG: zinc ribbon domain-containing protein [Aeromicrobium sp.]
MTIDIEDVQSTRSEKFLAIILTSFLLMGSVWIYVKADVWVPGGMNSAPSVAQQHAMDRSAEARQAAEKAAGARETAASDLDLAKNDFDIAAAKGGSTDAAERRYRAAADRFAQAEHRAADAADRASDAQAQMEAYDHARQRQSHARHDWMVAGVRLAFIVTWLLASLRIVRRLRERSSRFQPLGFAAVATGVITAVVYATDYITDFIDPLELGPIVLSGIGTLATMGAFVGLQEWLERRLPGKRVRNGECPYCAHPIRGGADAGPYCEGCGNQVIEPCGACGTPRRVGSPHCPACGHD